MADRFWVGGTGTWQAGDTSHWSASSGGTSGASVPTSSDNAIFNGSSGGGTITIGDIGSGVTCLALNFTGFTGALSCAQSSLGPRGDITFGSGMSFSGSTDSAFLQAQGTVTVTSNGKTLPFGVYFTTGSFTLADAFAATGPLRVDGTLNAANFSVTANCVELTFRAALTMGSGIWTLTGAEDPSSSGPVWSCNAAATVTANTSTIKLTDASSTAKVFAGGGKTYNNIWLTGSGTGEFQFTGSNTFNDFKCDTPPHTIKFTAGTTTAVTTFTVAGTAGNLMTIGSLTSSSHTLSCASGSVTVPYASISYSSATGGASWMATSSVNGGNNTGWIFSLGSGLFWGNF